VAAASERRQHKPRLQQQAEVLQLPLLTAHLMLLPLLDLPQQLWVLLLQASEHDQQKQQQQQQQQQRQGKQSAARMAGVSSGCGTLRWTRLGPV
jgi:hypothetical protein